MGATRIDVAEVTRILRERKLGTGTMAQKLGLSNDGFQKVLYLGEADAEVAKKLFEILGMKPAKAAVAQPEPAAKTEVIVEEKPDLESLMAMKAADLIAAVESGDVSKEAARQAEEAREHPRASVLKFLDAA